MKAKSRKLSGIILDIGNTLVDCVLLKEKALEVATNKLHEKKFIDDPQTFKDDYLSVHPGSQYIYSKMDIVKEVWLKSHSELDYRAIGLLIVTYRQAIRRLIQPSPELTKLMTFLKERGIKIGAISNGFSVQQLEQLCLLDIIDHFDTILISGEENIRKPSPEIFLRALQNLKLKPQETLMIGDSIEADMIPAKDLGMETGLLTVYLRCASAQSSHPAVDHVFADYQSIISFMVERIHCDQS